MFVSDNIPIDAERVVSEILERQQLPWNNGRINDYRDFPSLRQIFRVINSGIPKEDFFYQGDLFRLHTPYVTTVDWVDTSKERIIGKVCSDGSCSVLPLTEYSPELVAFSKRCDFTDRKVFYKVSPTQRAVLLHINTGTKYGIDVNKLLQRFDILTRYEGEQEVLFPLEKGSIVKEYYGTPNKFRYYLRERLIK